MSGCGSGNAKNCSGGCGNVNCSGTCMKTCSYGGCAGLATSYFLYFI